MIDDLTKLISSAATLNDDGSGNLLNIELTGDYTSTIKAGDAIRYQHLLAQTQNAYVSTISYNSGTNKTTIVPTTLVSLATTLTNRSLWFIPLYFQVKTNKNVCNFAETVSVDLANGTTYFNQTLTLVLSKRETTKRTFIEKLVDGQKQLSIVVLDTNGIYWLFGLNEGVYTTGIEGGSGTAKADMNGYTITFTAMEPDQAYEIDSSAIENFFV